MSSSELDPIRMPVGEKRVVVSALSVQLKTPGTSGRVRYLNEDPEYRRTGPDGTFRMDNVLPGEYRFSVLGLPAGLYVKEVRFGIANALNGRIFVSSSTDTLEILLSPHVGMIGGEALDAAGQAAPGAQVVLIPAQDRERTELFRTATADSNGRFTIPSVAPGEYILAAWISIEPYAFFDPKLDRSG